MTDRPVGGSPPQPDRTPTAPPPRSAPPAAAPLAAAPAAAVGRGADPSASGRARRRRPDWLTVVRLVMLALVAVLAVLEPDGAAAAPWVAGLAVVALAATAALPRAAWYLWPLLLVEVLVVALSAPRTGGADSPLLPYLAATALAAGTRLNVAGGMVVAGLGAVGLLAGRASFDPGTVEARRYLTAAAQWSVVASMVALGSSALRSTGRAPTVADRYAEAYRLIDQLRAVSRRLPGSLDPGTVANTLLDRIAGIVPYRRGAVLLVTEERLVPLALRGTRRLPWRPSPTEPGPISDALRRRAPAVDRREADTDGTGRRAQPNTLLALPIVVDERPVGLVLLDSPDVDAFPDDVIARLGTLAVDTGLPLETARLFEEVRSAAADEERSRLAHEMHDGIAQDLAYVGYELDALTARIRAGASDAALADARALRRRITDLVGDMRLSITDLRSSVGPTRGLGLALSEYARSVGTATGVTVHLSLRETSTRLASDVETELLRIAHEAIAAARRGRLDAGGKRVRPANLWVGLVVDPPTATLTVEDDGPSTVEQASVEVMRERATRLGARLDAGLRVPSGVRVRVDVEGGAG